MNEELKVILKAELSQFKAAMKEAISGIKSVANESRKASKEIDGFTADVNQQGKALSDLKRKYIDLAAAHGKESKEAKEAADAIKKLSAEYKTNKALATDLANQANKFDLSLGSDEGKKNVDDTNESVEGLRDSLVAIRNLDFAEVMLEAFGPEVKKHIAQAKAEFDEARGFFIQIFQNFDKSFDSELFDKDNPSIFDRIGGMGESFKELFKGIGKGFKQLGQGLKEAFGGTVGILAVLIADLLIIIGLTKNALNVAKEVKEIATQASKSGMNTSTFQEWGYVFKQVGVEEDKLVDFTKKLAEKQNELRDGTEGVAEAFEAIGISQEEVLGSNQEELFRKTVKGLQGIKNESERTSASFRIFTDDATDLTNLLYLTNQETQSLVDNYYALGGAPSDNLINKSKILGGSTTNLSYAWQGLRNTLAEWVIPAVIAVVQWLTTAVAYINAFLQGIFGVKEQSQKASTGLNNMSSGVNKVGSNAKKATGAIKELLRYTMGFDELNIIPKQSTGSGSGSDDASALGGYGGTNINPELPVIEVPDLSKFREFMDKYGSIIQGILTWTLMAIGAFLAVSGFASGNFPLGILGLSMIGLSIGVGAAGGEESHWNKVANVIKNVWNGIKTWFNTYVKPPFTKEWWVEKWNNIKNAATESMNNLKQAFADRFAPIKEWFNTYIKPVFTKQFWIDLWNSILLAAHEKLVEITLKIQEKWKPIKQWFDEKVKPVFTKEYWITKWNNIKQAASDKLAEIKAKIDEKIAPLKNWFENKLKPIFTVDYWKTKWNTIKDGAKSAFNGVIDIVERAINKIINQINILSWKVPDWVPKIGGNKWGFNFKQVSIPRLEAGGIANSSILANIGERGREAVLPLENHTEWMDMLADRINSRNNTPSRIVLMVDSKELGYATINGINGITRQTGQLQLQLV